MPWKFMQIEPQPARGTLREEMWESPGWIAEEKYDGDRRIAQFCGRVVRFTGRRKSVDGSGFVEKTQNVPHLSAHFNAWSATGKPVAMRALHLGAKGEMLITPVPLGLEGTVLDGEMIFNPAVPCAINVDEGGRSKYVTSIMGSLPEEAVRKQIERGWLRYVVFDCLFYRGRDLRGNTLDSRRMHAEQAIEEWGNPFINVAPRPGNSESKRFFYDNIVDRGGEGIILKHRDHKYGDKTGWVKVKKTSTADVVIMGFIPAKEMSVKKGDDKATMTKYAKAGLIGAVQCGQHTTDYEDDPTFYGQHHGKTKLIEVATVSGMTDALRAEFTKHPKKHIGRVITIEHNGREPTGRFRHPRLADNTDPFRGDKRAADCVYREDES